MNFWDKIRFWLIKKLGGYISPYNELPVKKLEFIPVSRPIHTLQCDLIIPRVEAENHPDILKNRVARELATELCKNKDLVYVRSEYDPYGFQYHYRVTLEVVEPKSHFDF